MAEHSGAGTSCLDRVWRDEEVWVDQMTVSAPRDPRCFRRGYATLRALSSLNKTHSKQNAADQISVADQVSQQAVGSHRLNILNKETLLVQNHT